MTLEISRISTLSYSYKCKTFAATGGNVANSCVSNNFSKIDITFSSYLKFHKCNLRKKDELITDL